MARTCGDEIEPSSSMSFWLLLGRSCMGKAPQYQAPGGRRLDGVAGHQVGLLSLHALEVEAPCWGGGAPGGQGVALVCDALCVPHLDGQVVLDGLDLMLEPLGEPVDALEPSKLPERGLACPHLHAPDLTGVQLQDLCPVTWRRWDARHHVLVPECQGRIDQASTQLWVVLDAVDPEIAVAQEDSQVGDAASRDGRVPEALSQVGRGDLVAPGGAPLAGGEGVGGLALEQGVGQYATSTVRYRPAVCAHQPVDVREEVPVGCVEDGLRVLVCQVTRHPLVLLGYKGLQVTPEPKV